MRMFVAVWPAAHVMEVLAGLSRPDVAGLRWTGPEQWHVTLRFLGDCDADDAAGAVQGVRWSSPVTADLGPQTGRFGRRVLHVPVGGLDGVAAEVVRATAGVGERPEDRAFHGHITLARARDRRGVDLRPLCGVPAAAEWPVSEVALVVSRLGGGPARYETVLSVPVGT